MASACYMSGFFQMYLRFPLLLSSEHFLMDSELYVQVESNHQQTSEAAPSFKDDDLPTHTSIVGLIDGSS